VTALLLLTLLQDSREVPLSERAVEVRVPVAADGRHPATVVTFPEETLEALVAGWAEGDLTVERRRENLFLKLLRRVEGDLHVLGGSGRLYRLSIRPADGAYDGRVRLLAAAAKAPSVPAPIELIRAMRLGRRPAEGAVLRAQGEVYAGPDLVARLAYAYDAAELRGYVIRVENRSETELRLDPSRFAGASLLLVGAREMVLAPGASTLLYAVFGKTP
jgi:hypothetical protein